MSRTWRALRDGNLTGVDNMARDRALLELVADGQSSPCLRLYGWSPPCVSLGRHQGDDVVDHDFCRRHFIDIVTRPTGGRAVLHHLELTYSVVARLGHGRLPTGLQEAYALLCGALVDACQSFGIATQLTAPTGTAELPSPSSPVPCFRNPAPGEVVVHGRKLIGSAMRRHHQAILQHGSILLDWDSELQAGALGLADDSSLRPFVTTFAEQLGEIPPRAEIEQRLMTCFAARLEVAIVPGTLTPAEHARAELLAGRPQAGLH